MRKARSPFHSAPAARDSSARVAFLSAISTVSQSNFVRSARSTSSPRCSAVADLARDALGQQVVDRDRVLVAVEVDDQPEDRQCERQRGADRRQRLRHATGSLSVATSMAVDHRPRPTITRPCRRIARCPRPRTSPPSSSRCSSAGASATSSASRSGAARAPRSSSSTRARRPPTGGRAPTTCSRACSRTSSRATRRCSASTSSARAAGTATACRSRSRSSRSSASPPRTTSSATASPSSTSSAASRSSSSSRTGRR